MTRLFVLCEGGAVWRAGGRTRGPPLPGVCHHPGPQPGQPAQEWKEVRRPPAPGQAPSPQSFLLQALVDPTNC